MEPMKVGQKKNIITISGPPGSGKSSTAKGVAEQLGFQHFSSGDLFRALAKEHGLDTLQANLSAEEDAKFDRLVDGRLQEIGETGDQLVLDSRTAWHWMPESFKIFLHLDLEVAAQRILDEMDDERLANEHVHRDPVEYAAVLKRRLESEARRYKTKYDINPYDENNYDLVIDSGENSLEQVVELIIRSYRSWLEG
jgi:cytidylate kinase